MDHNTVFYNYYNVSGRYSPKVPEKPHWKEKFEVKEDSIKSKNYSQDSSEYKAYKKLEDTYYAVSVQNRAKYSTEEEVRSAIYQKYARPEYSQYSYTERSAMLHNELEMTLFGCLSGGGIVEDPHLTGKVRSVSESEKKQYNQKMVNIQLGNLLSNNGIDSASLSQYNMTFTIDPLDYSLRILGVENATLVEQMEKVLNSGKNSQELFFHILHTSSSSISKDVLQKYRTMKDFQNITGENINSYHQTKEGFLSEEGKNILDVYKEALKTSNKVPNEYKSVAYDYFKEKIEEFGKKEFANIPDMNLSIGYANGQLYPISDEGIMKSSFSASV